ncbi:hypothetical protein [Sabulibacter ruber]|uniref:hypothetical protein n=1 Tax=Sabulibacter ruber TaxID=2811901 RepID=UPI001A96B31A|nr:hypothetical protein [Sabulibacter ruber]
MSIAATSKILLSERQAPLEQDSSKVAFTSIEQVVRDSKQNTWVEIKGNSASLALHFNPNLKDTLSVSYSSECWLYFPYKIENGRLILYWYEIIDSKYKDFEVVKAIRKVKKKYRGQPFLVLELANETTLRATYLLPDLIKKINNSSKERILFPNTFTVIPEVYL